MCWQHVGVGHVGTLRVFVGSVAMPLSETMCPRYVTAFWNICLAVASSQPVLAGPRQVGCFLDYQNLFPRMMISYQAGIRRQSSMGSVHQSLKCCQSIAEPEWHDIKEENVCGK